VRLLLSRSLFHFHRSMQRPYQNNPRGTHRSVGRSPDRGAGRGMGRGMGRGIGRSIGGRVNDLPPAMSPEARQIQQKSARSFAAPILRTLSGQSLMQRRAAIELDLARLRKQEEELAATRQEIRAAVKQGVVRHFLLKSFSNGELMALS
jgi:hypothetical protein